MRSKSIERTTLAELFQRKDCLGYAWRAADKNRRYMWQSTNDLGLFAEDLDEDVLVIRKIEVVPRLYLYIVSIGQAINSDGNDATINKIIEELKERHCL